MRIIKIKVQEGDTMHKHSEQKASQLFRAKFSDKAKKFDISGLAGVIDGIFASRKADQSVIDLYRFVADSLPGKIPKSLYIMALSFSQDRNPGVSENGNKVLVALNLRTMFTVAKPFMEYLGKDEQADMFQTCIQHLQEKLRGHTHPYVPMSQFIHREAEIGFTTYIASKENIPYNLALMYVPIMQGIREIGNRRTGYDGVRQFAKKVINKAKENGREVPSILTTRYIKDKFMEEYAAYFGSCRTKEPATEENPEKVLARVELAKTLSTVLRTLTPKEEKIIRTRFGMGEGSEATLEDVATLFGETRERIRQIEAKAIRALRRPNKSDRLKIFLKSDKER